MLWNSGFLLVRDWHCMRGGQRLRTVTFLLRYASVPDQLHQEGNERMNGETKKAVTYSAVMLGVALALGAVIGNDKTRNVIVDKSRDLFSNLQKN